MAGISAGHSLTEAGVDDFKIIEYQDRIGGRTLHTHFGEKPDGSPYTVELGTNWVRVCRSIDDGVFTTNEGPFPDHWTPSSKRIGSRRRQDQSCLDSCAGS